MKKMQTTIIFDYSTKLEYKMKHYGKALRFLLMYFLAKKGYMHTIERAKLFTHI
jgi:hypothetical protein